MDADKSVGRKAGNMQEGCSLPSARRACVRPLRAMCAWPGGCGCGAVTRECLGHEVWSSDAGHVFQGSRVGRGMHVVSGEGWIRHVGACEDDVADGDGQVERGE